MDYGKTITGIFDVPQPKKFEINIENAKNVAETIEGLPAGWVLKDQQLQERYGGHGLSLAYKLFSTSTLGVVSEHDVGRRWQPTLLGQVRWSYQRGSTKSLLLQPAFAALQDEKKTTSSERVKGGLAALYQGPTSGADTSRIASKVTKLLNGSYDDTVWLMRLAYYYIITAVAEASTGGPVRIVDAEAEQLVSAYTQSGFASNLADVITAGRDVVYLDHDGPMVSDEMIATTTYMISGTTLETPWGTGVANLPRMVRPLVFVQGREAGIRRAAMSTLEHENVAAVVGHYVSVFNAGAGFDRALKVMAFLMSRGVGGPRYHESYLVPASNMQAAVAGYLLTGPAAVVCNAPFPLVTPPQHSFYEGSLRRMMFEASINALKHAAGVHHLVPPKGAIPTTITRAWELLLATGREGGYAAALDQIAAQAGWQGCLGGLLKRHSFTTKKVAALFDRGWAIKATQWAELLPWVSSYPTQATVLARLAPVKLVTAKCSLWQPVADVVGRDGAVDAFLTIMLESDSAEVAAKFSDGLVSELVRVPRVLADGTGWQADFSVPTMAPHLGGFSELKARINSDRELVRLMAVASRPATTWKIKWYDSLLAVDSDMTESKVLWDAIRQTKAARTSMDPAVLAQRKERAEKLAVLGAHARTMAEDDVQYALSLVSHMPQYRALVKQYEAAIRMGADLSRSGLFMDAVRDMARILDDVDHVEASKAMDAEDRRHMIAGMARLCDITAQLSEANAMRTNLGRMAAGLRAIGGQLADNPSLTLEEYQSSAKTAADTLADGLRGREISHTEKDAVYTELMAAVLRNAKASALADDAENEIRQQLASGGSVDGWLDSQEATAGLIATAEARVKAIMDELQWTVDTGTSEKLAREAARNGHGTEGVATAALPAAASTVLSGADFISGPSSAEGGLIVTQQTTETSVPMDMELEDSQPMLFQA
jgi:hypothetical protein